MSIERFRAQFLEQKAAHASDEPGWLALVRTSGLERFLERGFPTTKDEEWRFTNVAPISSQPFELARSNGSALADDAKRTVTMKGLDAYELVFVDGHYAASLSSVGSLPDGVIVSNVASALADHIDLIQPSLSDPGGETPFADLNAAFFADGAFVHVSQGVVLERPIHLVFLTSASEPSVAHPRSVIVGESGSQFRVVESYGGSRDSVYWTNAVTQVVARDGAVIDHYKLQRESTRSFHTASVHYEQAASAAVSNLSLSLGARIARHDIRSDLAGEGADVTLNGLYVVGGAQHVDHHTVIDHRVPRCTSRELYKGVLDDASSGVFNGRVIVRPNAQKTDSRQSNKNLLLSNDALVNTNPQLEINADDVKCAHGATIGQLDPDAMFYLRSRGIAEGDARRILTEGFMADVSNRIRLAAVKDSLRALLFRDAA